MYPASGYIVKKKQQQWKHSVLDLNAFVHKKRDISEYFDSACFYSSPMAIWN